jgi:hypothetical protein
MLSGNDPHPEKTGAGMVPDDPGPHAERVRLNLPDTSREVKRRSGSSA